MISILVISSFALVAALGSAAAIAPRERELVVNARPWPFDTSSGYQSLRPL
jgi:hypothetical protein